MRQLKTDNTERHFYTALADRGDVDAVFPRPTAPITVTRKPVSVRFAPQGAITETLSFESPYQTLNPALQPHYSTLRRNGTAWAQYWRHGDKPRPTLCVIHGFILDSHWLNSRFFHLDWFYRQGYDIVLYTLPFHGNRQERWAPYSGHGVFSYGACHLNETILQGVHDFRLLMNWLQQENGVEKVGVGQVDQVFQAERGGAVKTHGAQHVEGQATFFRQIGDAGQVFGRGIGRIAEPAPDIAIFLDNWITAGIVGISGFFRPFTVRGMKLRRHGPAVFAPEEEGLRIDRAADRLVGYGKAVGEREPGVL